MFFTLITLFSWCSHKFVLLFGWFLCHTEGWLNNAAFQNKHTSSIRLTYATFVLFSRVNKYMHLKKYIYFTKYFYLFFFKNKVLNWNIILCFIHPGNDCSKPASMTSALTTLTRWVEGWRNHLHWPPADSLILSLLDAFCLFVSAARRSTTTNLYTFSLHMQCLANF